MIINESFQKNNTKRGMNRAELKDGFPISIYEGYISKNDDLGTCVFISHKSTDTEVAAAIAAYIKDCGIDVYIDVNDEGLQIASQNNDSQEIVSHIQKGLRLSTHVLALISDDTKESWWVPYEIGYGDKAGKEISSMLLEQDEVDNFPDYLKISRRLFSIADFMDFITKLKRKKAGDVVISETAESLRLPDINKVSKYIKEVKVE